MIEKGRHSGIESKFRFCPFCPNEVEDEKHFLMKCKPLSRLRSELLDKGKKSLPSLGYICEKQRFITLMSNNNVSGFTTQYINRALDLRENTSITTI